MEIVGNVQLIRGSSDSADALVEMLEGEGFKVRGNADAYVRVHGNFGVEDARELRERASTRAFAGGRRIFIVSASSMTNEAQNALLKTLEEPSSDSLFFFIVPSPENLLPTLRSRAQALSLPKTKMKESEIIDSNKFLASTPAARLEMVKPLLERDEDDKRDLGAIITFLSSLERMLGDHMSSAREGLEAIYRARRYLSDKGSLVKPLIEQVALLVPILK